MADITERIGFETAGAISSLNSLQKAIRGVNTALRTLNKNAAATGMQSASAEMKKLDANAKQAATSMQTVGTKATTAANKAASAGRSMTISWQTFGRVLMTQAIVRTLDNLIQSLFDASEAAGKFQVDVARMAQITEEGSAGISSLSKSLEGLSISLGRDIEEVSTAAFEALQNDLGTTAETMELLKGAAGDLALVTGSKLVNSVNSISSVLKSYNLDIKESADIADIFFVAIDKGRITLDQLESRLGTVTPQAAALGISFKESAAAAASLTLSGLNSQTAMTQLRNILAKLIKPTDDLKEAFRRLGVTSGTELIQKFGGLKGALAALKVAFNNDEQAVARAFNTIRGQLGVLNLLANEGTNFNHVLEAMEDRAGRAAKAAGEIDKVTQRNIDKEMQKLNKTLRNVGERFNEVKLAALEFFNTLLRTGNVEAIEKTRVKAIEDSANAMKQSLKDTTNEILKTSEVSLSTLSTILKGPARAAAMEYDSALTLISVKIAEINAKLSHNRAVMEENVDALKNLAKETALSTAPWLGEKGVAIAKLVRQFAKETTDTYADLAKKAKTANLEQLGQLREELNLRKSKVDSVRSEGVLTERTSDALDGQSDAVGQIIAAREQELGLNKASAEGIELRKGLEAEYTALLQANIDQIGTGIPGAAANATLAIEAIPDPQIDVTAAMASLDALAAKAAQTAAAVAAANSGGSGLYHGGRVDYHAVGGPSRGMDRYPAMLAADEYVMNARSGRKFFSQLQAMNSGQSPQYREVGGSVTNIGDINVNVTGGAGSEAPDRLGKQIANSLRRELRRKTSAL